VDDRWAIYAENVSFTYPGGIAALRDVNFAVGHGEKVALLGPNGAGKSTLFLAICGALEVQGKIFVEGEPVSGLVGTKVGMVFQDPDDQLFMPTVFDDVAFGPLNQGVPREEVPEVVRRALAAVGLEGYESRPPHQLSFGEKKRVSVATVLSMNVSVLLLDEPSTNLDARGRKMLCETIARLPQARVVATHDLQLAAELCERAVILDEGRVVADGALEEILRDEGLLRAHGLMA